MRQSHAVNHTLLTLVLLLACISPAFGLPARAAGATVYVDAANTSGVEDGTLAHPYNAVQEGISAATDGDTVRVAAGTYREKIVLKSRVQLRGEGAGLTRIDAAGQNDTAVYVDGAGPGTLVDGFTIANGFGRRVGGYTYGGAFYVSNATLVIRNCILVDNHATDGAGGIQSVNSTLTVDRCVSRNSNGWWGGALSVDGGTAILQNSIVDGSKGGYGGALYMSNGASFTSVNNLITHTASNIPAIGVGSNSNAAIINTTIVNNGANGIETNTYPTGFGLGAATIRNTILWGNADELVNLSATYSDIQDGDAGTGNIAADPLFRDPASDNYRLSWNSPCVDTGTGEGAPAFDLDGDPRPIDGNRDGIAAVDIGADEFNSPFRVHLPAAFTTCPPTVRDDFSDPATGWPVADDADHALGYLNGEYRILAKTPNLLFYVTGEIDPGDYTVEVDVRAAGHLNGAAGLIFARGSAGYFVYAISDGAFSVLYRDSVARTWTVVIDWTASPVVHPGAQSNRLKVVHAQSAFRLYANGQPVYAAFPDAGRSAGGLGVGAVGFSPDYDARFDNFVVYTGACMRSTTAQPSATSHAAFMESERKPGFDNAWPAPSRSR